MKIKVGDNVKVITGSCKNKEGKVLKVLRNENRVIIEGLNKVKKHVKPNANNETGGILEIEAPIHMSNVKVIDKKAEKKEKTTTPKKKNEKESAK
ncbi:MAG: 50S ribosomal protein L24 [Bacilli bacterium]|nr:50S ribosomal protein L24 [Bacilli bacterium]